MANIVAEDIGLKPKKLPGDPAPTPPASQQALALAQALANVGAAAVGSPFVIPVTVGPTAASNASRQHPLSEAVASVAPSTEVAADTLYASPEDVERFGPFRSFENADPNEMVCPYYIDYRPGGFWIDLLPQGPSRQPASFIFRDPEMCQNYCGYIAANTPNWHHWDDFECRSRCPDPISNGKMPDDFLILVIPNSDSSLTCEAGILEGFDRDSYIVGAGTSVGCTVSSGYDNGIVVSLSAGGLGMGTSFSCYLLRESSDTPRCHLGGSDIIGAPGVDASIVFVIPMDTFQTPNYNPLLPVASPNAVYWFDQIELPSVDLGFSLNQAFFPSASRSSFSQAPIRDFLCRVGLCED